LSIEVEASRSGALSIGTPYPRDKGLGEEDSYEDDGVLDQNSEEGGSGRQPRGGRRGSVDSVLGRGRSETSASDYQVSEKSSEADRIFTTGSLSSVGLEGKDSFTPQQREILYGMWYLLRAGVEVMKHGLSGKPRQRFLYCDASMRAVFWRAQGGQPDAKMEAEMQATFGRSSAHASWGLGRTDKDRYILFKDILEVRFPPLRVLSSSPSFAFISFCDTFLPSHPVALFPSHSLTASRSEMTCPPT